MHSLLRGLEINNINKFKIFTEASASVYSILVLAATLVWKPDFCSKSWIASLPWLFLWENLDWTVKFTIDAWKYLFFYFNFVWNEYSFMKGSKLYPNDSWFFLCVLFSYEKRFLISQNTQNYTYYYMLIRLIGWRRFGTIRASLKRSRMFRSRRHARTLSTYVLESTVCVTS